MINLKKVSFNSLKSLSLSQRRSALGDSLGSAMASMLTPTQFAELFPRYYRERHPDIEGFLKAIPSSLTADRQKAREEKLMQTASAAREEGRIDVGGTPSFRKKIIKEFDEQTAVPVGKGKPLPQLTKEQAAAYDKIKQGQVDIDSPEAKQFSNLPKDKLASAGLEIVEDPQTHKKVMKYNEAAVSPEEAVSRLKTGGEDTGSSGAAKAAAEKYLGRSMSDREWDWVVRTTAAEATSHKGETAMVMASILNRARSGKYGGHSIEGVVSARQQFSSYTNGKAFNEPGQSRRNSIYSSASMLGGIDHSQTDFASANPRAYDKEGGRGEQKIQERLNKGFTRVGGQYFNAASRSTLADGPPVKPAGPNGQYSEKQIADMQEKLRTEKNEARRQQLANVLADIPGTPQNASKPGAPASLASVESGQVFGGHVGESKQCVALSKHYAPGVGAASTWKFHEGQDKIVPGAVIATTNYGNGNSGRMARDMPDGKSHYHTGVALTRPDGDGNVLILDQSAGKGQKITKININNYNGEKWGAVIGGEPSEKSMGAVNLALANATDAQKSAINSSLHGETPAVSHTSSTHSIKDNVDDGGESTPTKKRQAPVDQEGNTITTAAAGAPGMPGMPSIPGLAQVNPMQLIQGMMEDPLGTAVGTILPMIAQGLMGEGGMPMPSGEAPVAPTEAAPTAESAPLPAMAGGQQPMTMPSDLAGRDQEQDQQIAAESVRGIRNRSRATGEIDTSKFPYPGAVTPEGRATEIPGATATAAPAPETPVVQPNVDAPYDVTTKKTVNVNTGDVTETPLPAFAGGGRTKAKGPMVMAPIPPKRGDDTLVTDAAGKQFTMNRAKETATVNPKSDTIQIQQTRDLNKQHLLQAMNEYKVTDPHKRAAMAAVVQGESGFMPRSEKDYSTTSNKRIRSIFKSATKGMSDEQLTNLKKDPQAFFNKIYGGKLGNAKDEGYMYRGRGMVQLTGKSNYAKYGEKIGMKEELLKNPDLANRPDVAAKLAVAYMEDRTRKRGNDMYTKVARGVGNPVASTEKVKRASYQQFAQSGEFAPGRKAVFPDEQKTQFAAAEPKPAGVKGVPTGLAIPPERQRSEVADAARKFSPVSSAQASEAVPGTQASAFVRSQLAEPAANQTAENMFKSTPQTVAQPTVPSRVGGQIVPTAGSDGINFMEQQQQSIQQQTQAEPPSIMRQSNMADRDPNMIDNILDQSRNTFMNPTSIRAFSRANFNETGDAIDGFKYSLGNNGFN